jgi:hypothetical protein
MDGTLPDRIEPEPEIASSPRRGVTEATLTPALGGARAPKDAGEQVVARVPALERLALSSPDEDGLDALDDVMVRTCFAFNLEDATR